MRSIVVDAGAVVALLDATNRHHARALEFFMSVRPNDQLISTWPAATECFHLLDRSRNALFDWLASSGIEIIDFQFDDLEGLRRWMDGYRDREVDFADATLAWLAAEERTTLVATTDFNDFEAYRLAVRSRFFTSRDCRKILRNHGAREKESQRFKQISNGHRCCVSALNSTGDRK